MECVSDKLIRRFSDINGNEYKIYKKWNNHFYLTIKGKNENNARIIEGSKIFIFRTLQEIHKNTKFKE